VLVILIAVALADIEVVVPEVAIKVPALLNKPKTSPETV